MDTIEKLVDLLETQEPDFIQRMRDGLPVAEYGLREPYTLKVTI
jgi:hypothetical protein